MEAKSEKRFSVDQLDRSTYQVVDNHDNVEICVCGDFDEATSGAKNRALVIASLLNEHNGYELIKGFQMPGKNDPYWGLCPDCYQPSDHYVNVERDHHCVCHGCQTFWYIGSNLFSAWKEESPKTWEENRRLLGSYRQVEPIDIDLPNKIPVSRGDT